MFDGEPGRSLPDQRKELMLIFSHIQFAQHPSDCVPGSSPCVNTAGLGGGLNTLNMSDEEKPLHAGKLQDKVITLGIRELIAFGNKMRARGRIVGVVGK